MIAPMKISIFLAGITGFALLATASMASPSNITTGRRADFYAPGTHKFYVWCADGKDRIAYQYGASAKDAGAKLSEKIAETAKCRPSWEGRIGS